MRISECETILNEVEFVKSHTELIEKNKHRPKFVKPYIDRLEKYYKLKKNDWFSAHKKFWLLLIIPIIIFILVLLFLNNGKPINSNAVIDAYKEIDKEQTQRIEKLKK